MSVKLLSSHRERVVSECSRILLKRVSPERLRRDRVRWTSQYNSIKSDR